MLRSLTSGRLPLPRSVECLRSYSWTAFAGDLTAGITVGLVALPLSMAFSISSGLPPAAGIYCAVVAGFLISALGGSRTQIGGPTGAFVVVVANIVQHHGVDGLFMCTLMAGAILILLGLTGFGVAVKYLPRPVVIGFTNGIAVLIASTQIKDFFGLRIEHVPSEFIARISALVSHFSTLSTPATLTAAISLAVIIFFRRYIRRVPGSIVILLIGAPLAYFLGLSLETIEDRYGVIPSGLPTIVVPHFRADLVLPLLAPAITVAMLGAIESLLSAVVADRMSDDKHDPNVELFAQGVANVMSPLMGGLPATGAIARTATNIRSGARTPVAGMTHALVLLVILLVAAPLAGKLPLCMLAAILMMVCYNMGEWGEIRHILRLSKADIAVWLITFALTVFADLTVAVEAGMILAALLYIRKVTRTTTVERVTDAYVQAGIPHSLQLNAIPADVAVYRIHGPFLFGATDKLSVVEDDLPRLPRVVVLRLRNMTAVDATGLHALERVCHLLNDSGRHAMVCGARAQPAQLMAQAHFHKLLGPENVQPNLAAALARARVLLNTP
ncbi:MAG: STAS domain-containing protein [Phycisphaerales bacterium]|nr:STAS domain-containing protein [Phycisphaerales bacterium]